MFMKNRTRSLAFAFVIVASVLAGGRAFAALSTGQMVDLLKIVDDRQKNNGDWRASAYLEQKEKDKVDVVYETEYYRRSSDQKFMILFIKPKSSAGQGYLRIDKNLWFYDPSVGKWERRTERERIGGTNSRRSDFDESRLAEEYDPTDEGEEKLGAYTAQKLLLKGKAGIDLAFPHDPHLDRQGHEERPQAPGVRAVGPAAAHVVLPEVEEGPQRVEERRRLVPGGDPLLRRGREGEPDAGADQGGRPEARCPRTCSRRPGSRARAGDVRHGWRLSRRCSLAWTGTAWAQAGGDRPSEQDIFGGSAARDRPRPRGKPARPRQAGAREPARPPAAAAGARDDRAAAAPAPSTRPGSRAPPTPRTANRARHVRARQHRRRAAAPVRLPGAREPAADRRPALPAHAEHGAPGRTRCSASRSGRCPRRSCSTSTSTRARTRACAPSSSGA